MIALLTNCLKERTFKWGAPQQQSFEEIKTLLSTAPILVVPDFNKLFMVETNASCISVGAVLSQEQRPIEFFSEKLSDARRKWSTYDKNFMPSSEL